MRVRQSGRESRKPVGRQRMRGLRYWIAACALSAATTYAPVSPRNIASAAPLPTPAGVVSLLSSDDQRTRASTQRFDIQPGSLDGVIAEFEKTTGIKVTIPVDGMRSIPSKGVSGALTPEDALKQLLLDTGVTYKFTSSRAVTLELTALASSITVVGKVATPSSPKYTEPLRDIPQTIAIIPKEVIEEQGAMTLRDVLRNVPGLTITAGEGGAPAGDNLTLRGFSARNDIFVDGARDLGPTSRDPFNLEQVEIVKGPSSAFNGRGSTGGTINLVSKSPLEDAHYDFNLSFGTDRTKRFTGDINTPLKGIGLGDRTSLRLSLLAHGSDVAGRDVVDNERWGVAPSLAFGMGTRSRLILSYAKLKQENISDYGIPWVPVTNTVLVEDRDRPAPVPRETFYGYRDRDFERLNSDLATVRFERDVSDTVFLRNQLRYGRSTRDSNATPPRFASNNSTIINRELRAWNTEDTMWDNQTDFRARFSALGVEHSLVAGLALTNENNIRKTRTGPGSPTTMLNPNPDDIYTGVITEGAIVGDVTGKSIAAYAFDTVHFGEKFEINGGLRWDRFDVDGINTAGALVQRVDKMTSWRAGAVYKAKPNGSIYASYGTSLNPSLEGLSYGTANTAIDPEKSRNFEVGTKWDLARDRLLANAAFFRVEKTNARTPGLLPDDPPQVLEGEQRVMGLELSITGSITSKWRIFGAYTLMDSKVLDSNTPAEIGKDLINTPVNSFNIWTSYSIGKLNLGGGPRFVGKRFGNNINTRFVDKYWTLDAMASYPVARWLDLRVNLLNLNNSYYYDRLAGGHVIPGPSRSIMVSTGFHF